MIKIAGRLWLLMLCLSLVTNIASAAPSGIKSEGMFDFLIKKTSAKTFICSNTDCNFKCVDVIQPETCPNCGQPSTFVEKTQPAQNPGEVTVINADDNKIPVTPTKPEPEPIFNTILMIIPWLLVVLCLILIWKNISSLKNNQRATENLLKKIFPPKSEETMDSDTNQKKDILSIVSAIWEELKQLKEKVSKLERDVSNLQNVIKDLQRESNTFDNNRQKIYNEDTTPQFQPFAKDNYNLLTKPKPSPAPSAGLPTDEITRITDAFNKMMSEAAEMEGFNLRTLRNKFIDTYHVRTFKCVNYEERVNRSDAPPIFKSCSVSEATLWRIPLSNSSFAVLPGKLEYESTIHFQGGMKELFKSNYSTGSYRKIRLICPAIVRSDFSVISPGELRLMQ